MKPNARGWLSAVLPPVALFFLLVAGWQLGVMVSGVKPYLVPGPAAVWQAVYQHRDELVSATVRTGTAALCGFVLSVLLGTLIGIAFSQSAIVRRSFYPYAILLQTVPSVALAPLVICWFGRGFPSVVAVALIISLFPIITNSAAGLLAVDRNLLELFAMNNASRWQVLWKLRLPNSIPYLVTGAKISCGLSVIGAIVGEFSAGYGAQRGLGYLVVQAPATLSTDYLFAAVLAAMLLGVLIFGSVSLLGAWVLRRWHAPAEVAEQAVIG